MMRHRKTLWLWVGLVCILFSGIYLRIVNLDKTSYTSIEINEVFNAHQIYLGATPIFSANDSEQSLLFSRVIHYCFTAFGESELAARSVSIIWGTLLIVMMFFVGWRFVGKGNAGIIAAFITAFHPLLIDFSRIATIHNIYFFLLIFSFYAFFEGIEGTREKHTSFIIGSFKIRKIWALWNIDLFWLSVALLTSWSASTIFPQGAVLFYGLTGYCAVLFLLQYFHSTPRAALRLKYGILVVILTTVAVILWVNNSTFFIPAPNWSLQNVMGHGSEVDIILLNPANWTLATFALIGAVFSIVNMHKAGFYTLAVFLSFLILAQSDTVGVDYFFIFPLFVLLATYGVFEFAYYIRRQLDVQLINVNLEKRLHITPQRLIMGIFLAIVVYISPWFSDAWNYSNNSNLLYGSVPLIEWKEVGNYLKQNQNEGEPVISTNPRLVQYYGLDGHYYTLRSDKFSVTVANDSSKNWVDAEIQSPKDFKQIISQHKTGWIVLENSMLNENTLLQLLYTNGMNVAISKSMTTADSTAEIYRWEQARIQNPNEN
ncbi:MAG: hypothetical protein DWQ05_19825 [Calditrichaeota bacterium]|nr:MAG: hypothetical protein DWQ05_19825 [Calditrichota bacterium]